MKLVNRFIEEKQSCWPSFQVDFEDFLKKRANETIIAAQSQAELISKWDLILFSKRIFWNKRDNIFQTLTDDTTPRFYYVI